MDILKNILPKKIFESLERAGICTPKHILILSVWDLQKLTGLQKHNIELLKRSVANQLSPQIFTCKMVHDVKEDKIKSGCTSIDKFLNGGFRRGVLSEIYGESGSGKTQLCMQVAAMYASQGSVYICTEDLFPITRYNQINENLCQSVSKSDNNMFVEHLYEASKLLSCVRVRLPKLLQHHKISVVIIDSVAAPFRCETTNYIQRAEELRELAINLIKIAQEYNLAVICLNQVTASFEDTSTCNLLPSLGLAWSNMVSYRLCLKRNVASENVNVRELRSVFAPDLPNAKCKFLITENGITDLIL